MSSEQRLRSKKIQFWVSECEREFIKEKASYCNLSLSNYLREISKEGYIIKRDFSAITDVNAIGVNINQIARKVNIQDEVLMRDIEELRMNYEKLFEIMYSEIISG